MCTNNCNRNLVEKFALAIAPSVIGLLCEPDDKQSVSDNDSTLQELVEDVWKVATALANGAPSEL